MAPEAGSRKRVVGVIPARLGSTRLARKVLLPVAGRPMLEWVIEGAASGGLLDELIVATDSEEVLRFCSERGQRVEMTSPSHPSGTDRIFEVAGRVEGEVFVNIQGDEPLVAPEHIEALLAPVLAGEAEVSTLAVPMSREQAADPNRVKVVAAPGGRALYFSRSLIPYDREGSPGGEILKHLGFYAYTRAALELFHRLAPSPLELREKLEQLRLLENGVAIHVARTGLDTVGVDTEADLRQAERALLARRGG